MIHRRTEIGLKIPGRDEKQKSVPIPKTKAICLDSNFLFFILENSYGRKIGKIGG